VWSSPPARGRSTRSVCEHSPVDTRRYRWAILAAGTAAAATNATFSIGLPVIVPQLREEYDLSLGQIGVLLAASWIGTTLTLLPWGLAADRFGERTVLATGMLGSALLLVGAAFAASFTQLVLLLALVGAAGAAVNSSSGRAVMYWFGPEERGLALGVRQTAIPLGGLVGALTLPSLADAGGSQAAFLFLAGLIGVGALVGALVLRGREDADGIEPASVRQTIVDSKLWRLSIGSGLYLYAQIAVLGFGVLFLVDEHGFSEQSAALVFAGGQVIAMATRIGAGRWSDLMRSRVVPLRRVGLAIVGAMVVTALLAGGPVLLLVPVLIVACGLTMAWNGLSFTAAAELAGPVRSGAAIGVQQTVLSLSGVAAPVLFAVSVAQSSWALAFLLAAAFPLVGWIALRPLRGY
jgi:sugar phosphate permease